MKLLDRLPPADRARASEALARGLVGPERLERAVQRHLQALEAGHPSDLGVLLLQESAALAQSLDLSASHQGRQPRMGPYLLLSELGRGGMGRVFRARHVATGQEVALKVLNEGASSEEWARFQREAVTLARLRHPGIVPIVDYGEAGGSPYLALELVEGVTLAERVKRGGPLPASDALDTALQIAQALAAAHAQSVLHRDLKPANVLLRGKQALLTDFGLARSTIVDDNRLTATGMVVGTPAYMAPEQVRGREIDGRADVYALGATLYEMLTGQPPFPGLSAIATMTAVLEQDPPPPRQLNPAVDAELEQVCLRCLRKDPAQRYLDAATLVGDLTRLGRGSSFVLRAPALVSSSLVVLRRRARVLVAGLVLLAVGLLGASLGVLLDRRGGRGATRVQDLELEAQAATAWAAWLSGARPRAERLAADILTRAPAHPLALSVRARLRHAQGHLAPALVDAARACAAVPPRSEAFQTQALVRAECDPREALVAAERALELEPEHPPTLLIAARLRLLLHRDRAGAARALSAALTLAPTLAPAWELDSWLAEATGDPARAAEEAERALGLGAGSPSAWTRLGRLRLAAGDPRAAEEAFSRALAHGPHDRAALVGHARALSALGDWSGADEELEELEETSGLESEERLVRAWIRFRSSDGSGAVEDAEAATAAQPDQPLGWTLLALGRMASDDSPDGRREVRQALDRARSLGGEADGRYWLGEAALAVREGRPADAEGACAQAVAQGPEQAYAHLLRATIRSRAGRREDAKADLRRSVELSPLDETAWVTLANLLRGEGDQEGALRCLDEALQRGLSPGAQFHNLRANTLASLGRNAEALAAARAAIRSDRSDGEAWTTLANVAYGIRQFELAVQAASYAAHLRADPSFPIALRGLALASLGRNAEARVDLAQSLELAPQASWAAQVRQVLEKLSPR